MRWFGARDDAEARKFRTATDDSELSSIAVEVLNPGPVSNSTVTLRDAESPTKEGQIDFGALNVLPGAQVRSILDYGARTDGQPRFVGFNVQSATIATATWIVLQLFYDASGNLIDKQVLTDVAWGANTAARDALGWRAAAGD